MFQLLKRIKLNLAVRILSYRLNGLINYLKYKAFCINVVEL